MAIQQDNQPLRIQTPLPANAVLIEKLSGVERISEPFQFELDLLIQPALLRDTYGSGAHKYLMFERLLGQSATVTLEHPGCPVRCFNGIIVQLGEGLPEIGKADTELWRCTAVLAPKLWLLGRTRRSRVFQQNSVKDILEKLLKTEAGLDVTFSLSRAYDPRPLCLQHLESDLNFVSRLMEEEGIRYYFTHDVDKHTLVLNDAAASAVAAAHRIEATGWRKQQSIEPGHFQVRDHTLLWTKQTLTQKRSLPATVPVGPIQQTLKLTAADKVWHYQPEGRFAQRRDTVNRHGIVNGAELGKVEDEGSRAAELEMQRAACRAIAIEGSSNACQALPGFLFQLEGKHPQATGKYLFTEVEHRAALSGIYTDRPEAGLRYDNRFRALPEALPYRPQLITGSEPMHFPITATVVADGAGQAGEVVCDPHGRVKVQFHWDAAEDESTCWLWVAQAWAGNGFGSFFIPRVGNDVLVSFLNGQRDRPVITGSVHSDANPPPFWDPAHQSVFPTVNGVRTRTIQGGGSDYSQIAIDDKAQHELISVRANRDLNVHTVHDASVTTDNDLTVNTGHNADYHVGGALTWTVDGSATYQIGGSRSEIIGYNGWFIPDQLMMPPTYTLYNYSSRLNVNTPLETSINFGSHGYVMLDPADYLVNKYMMGFGGWKRLLTAVGGKTDFLYGNETRILYGTLAKNICRGQSIDSVLNYSDEERGKGVLSVAHLALLGLTVFLPLVRAKIGRNAALDGAISGLGLLLPVFQFLLKYKEKATRAVAIAEELNAMSGHLRTYLRLVGASADRPGVAAFSSALPAHVLKLASGESGMHHHEVEGNYCLQAGQVLLVSDGNVSIAARSDPGLGEGGDITLVGSNINGVARSYNVSSETIQLESDLAKITMSNDGITLQAGPDSKIEITDNNIVLRCGGSSLEITPAKITRLGQLLEDQAVALDAHQ